MPVPRHSLGTYPGASFNGTLQGTIGYSRLSSLSHCGLILAYESEMSVRELISSHSNLDVVCHKKKKEAEEEEKSAGGE